LCSDAAVALLYFSLSRCLGVNDLSCSTLLSFSLFLLCSTVDDSFFTVVDALTDSKLHHLHHIHSVLPLSAQLAFPFAFFPHSSMLCYDDDF
jgi:hypothetical protein